MAEYISREAVFDALKGTFQTIQGVALQRAIRRIPTANVKPVKYGAWQEINDETADPFFRRKFFCSVCGDWQTYGETNYCPMCGAQMISRRTEEE